MDERLLNRNRNITRGFRKLVLWQEAIELYVFVKEKIRKLNEIPFKVKAQVEDSVYSCHSNTAEGYSRRSIKEYIQFINISLSSLAENYSQIFALYSGNEIEIQWFDEYDKKHYSLENKLIQLNKTMISKVDKFEWKSDYVLHEIMEQYDTE
jgi:four helix bundle protein